MCVYVPVKISTQKVCVAFVFLHSGTSSNKYFQNKHWSIRCGNKMGHIMWSMISLVSIMKSMIVLLVVLFELLSYMWGCYALNILWKNFILYFMQARSINSEVSLPLCLNDSTRYLLDTPCTYTQLPIPYITPCTREPGHTLENPTPPAELALSQPCGSSALSFSNAAISSGSPFDTAVQLHSVCIEDSYV